MDKFVFKRKLPVFKIILGSAALAAGLFALVSLNFRGFIIIGMGVFLLLVEGSEFDFETNKYRQIKSILGFSIGTWKPIPKIDYISVFKTNEKTTLRQTSAEANVVKEVIKLNLFYNKNKKIEAYNTYNKEDGFEKAEQIAALLNTRILDATEKPSKWYK